MARGVKPKLIFLLSPPRAGSTMAQRVLAAHSEIATTPEPWVLLPPLFALRERGAVADYGHVMAARAIRDFSRRLPGGEGDYLAEIREFALSLYERVARGYPYFLDKTPRYYFIVEDLFRLFPDAKFLFLWRNPLAVAASIVTTFGGDRWRVARWQNDLFLGVTGLVDAYERHRDVACAVRFEDLVTDPLDSWPKLFRYLNLEFQPSLLKSFGSVDLKGLMGDQTGAQRYSTLDTEPINKWRSVMASPYRKSWGRRYLNHIGGRRLGIMGYDVNTLLDELNAVPRDLRQLGPDLVDAAYGRALWAARRAATSFLGPRKTLWPEDGFGSS
jgi:hypothetical protein